MKIEIVEEVAGMENGTQKNVPTKVAENLIERGLAVEVKEKKTKATEEK